LQRKHIDGHNCCLKVGTRESEAEIYEQQIHGRSCKNVEGPAQAKPTGEIVQIVGRKRPEWNLDVLLVKVKAQRGKLLLAFGDFLVNYNVAYYPSWVVEERVRAHVVEAKELVRVEEIPRLTLGYNSITRF